MNVLWGALMLLIGFFLFISSLFKSNFIIYRLFLERSKVLWGNHAYTFLLVVGLVIMGFSSTFFFNLW